MKTFALLLSILVSLSTSLCAEITHASTAAKTAVESKKADVENKKAEQQGPSKNTESGQNSQGTSYTQSEIPSTFGSVFISAKEYFLKPFDYIMHTWENMHSAKKAEHKIEGEEDNSSVVVKADDKVKTTASEHLHEPISHEAVYNIQFIAEEGSDYSDTKGQMTIEMVRYDENWITKQTSSLEIMSPEGAIRTSTFLSSLESQNGCDYRFAAKAEADSVVQDYIQGSARLTSSGGQGTVVYEAPEHQKIDLPAATVFPIRHMKMLMDAGSKVREKNFQILNAVVFDGSNDSHDAVRVEAIVAAVDPQSKTIKIQDSMRPKKLWRAEMRIFALDNKTAEPDYTITQVFSDQGILFEVVVDYGDYKMVSTLSKLKVYTEGDMPAALKFESFGFKPTSMTDTVVESSDNTSASLSPASA